MKKYLYLTLVVFIILLVGWAAYLSLRTRDAWTCVNNRWVKSGNPVMPMPTLPCLDEKITQITVTSPKEGDAVSLPLIIEGSAKVSDNQLHYSLLNEDQSIITEGFLFVKGDKPGTESSFKESVFYPEPKSKSGVLEVFDFSGEKGVVVNKVTVPISFSETDAVPVKVFFMNTLKDSGADCTAVYPLERRIPKTDEVNLKALESLISGPTKRESSQGYFTNIQARVEIQKLTIEKGVARVDFNKRLDENIGGSCMVAAIRAQITQTLKQFSSVTSVVISIDGRSEDILQP